METNFDILIIGGGPAGYSAAVTAAQCGKKNGLTVALVEERQLGGTCLNRGCIPAKTFLEAAHTIDQFKYAAQRGIETAGIPAINLPKLFQFKNRIVKRLGTGIGVLLRDNGVPVINGRAVVETKKDELFIVNVSAQDGKTQVFTAKKVILAAGAKPAVLPIQVAIRTEQRAEGFSPPITDRIWNSNTVYDTDSPLKEIPKTLAILGGGVIGIETARIFRSFGSEVVIIEAAERILPSFDTEVADAVKNSLTEKKIKVLTGQKLIDVKCGYPEADLTLCLENGETLSASALLVAVGRVPNTAAALLQEILELIQVRQQHIGPLDVFRGEIYAGNTMKTELDGLYLAGDCHGLFGQLAHVAIEEGKIAAKNAVASLTEGTCPFTFIKNIPACIYGEPEAAGIGLTEYGIEKSYEKLFRGEDRKKIRIRKFPFAANGRAATAGVRSGFVKIISLNSKILGVHIAGPCASELINEASLAMSANLTAEQWMAAMHAHPSFGEVLTEALLQDF